MPILKAAEIALTEDQSWMAGRNDVYRARRDIVVDRLLEMGFETRKPKASFYVWVKVQGGQSATEYANRLLREAHVSVAPGSVFGAGGEGYFRIALTKPKERLSEAMDRLESLASTH